MKCNYYHIELLKCILNKENINILNILNIHEIYLNY